MKTYQINVNGQDYTVEIDDLTVSPVTVQVNGKTFKVTIAEQIPPTVRPVTTARVIATAKAVAAPELEIDLAESFVPTVTSTFVDSLPDIEPEPVVTTDEAPVPEGNLQSVVAPMPGKVMDIVVSVGERVKHGDTLCSLEAMKMKTPIRSTTGGVVTQVLVNEGQNVSYGDVLFTLG